MITIDIAYTWLHHFSHDKSQLSSCVNLLLKELKDAIHQQCNDQAWIIIEQLKRVSQKTSNDLEVGEILLECGRAAYQLGHWEQAADLFSQSAEHYHTRPHAHAVALWMLGYVLWSLPARHEAGMTAWQRSISIFDELARKRSLNSQAKAWYQDRWQEMVDSVECALGADCHPPASPSASPFAAASASGRGASAPSGAPAPGVGSAGAPPNPPTHPSNPSPVSAPPIATSDILRLFRISEEIPAGGFGASGTDPFPIAYADVEQLRIDGRSYRVVSLPRGRTVNVLSSKDHMIIKVKGDSMDLEGIDDGDWVLLRFQNVAAPGDIVAAEIVGEDTRATLKRYERRGSTIILKPVSRNPAHQRFEFNAPGDGFHICGVAVAVLKTL